MQVSKQIIEKDAKDDTEFIKKKVESSIGDNNPLSEEVSKYQKRNIASFVTLSLHVVLTFIYSTMTL